MQVYKLKAFARFQRRERIADTTLAKAIRDAENGLIDADLRGGLIKQRVARPGQGKSGGFRTVIAYQTGERAVFLFGFAKSQQANLVDDELAYWRQVGREYLGLDDDAIEVAIEAEIMTEVDYGDED